MKIAWVTDPHLNFISRRHCRRIGETLATHADALLVTGDIAEIPTLRRVLRDLGGSFRKPVWFVLGNHDAYHGTLAQSRRIAADVSGKLLHWLPKAGVVHLDEETALVGHDGWYDAQYGDPLDTRFEMSDWDLIVDFKDKHRLTIIDMARQLGHVAANEAEFNLRAALQSHRTVLFATHFPPFAQSTWHRGERSEVSRIPWYSSKAMGDMLVDVAYEHPDKRIVVLCGHTHSPGIFEPVENLIVINGESEYTRPRVSAFLEPDAPSRWGFKFHGVEP
jgi:Icc-related predicted phosphoesterase